MRSSLRSSTGHGSLDFPALYEMRAALAAVAGVRRNPLRTHGADRPLSWGGVRASHEWLATHAACPGAQGVPPSPPPQARPSGGGYTSEDDTEPCFCTHIAAVWAHIRHVCKESCIRRPGPICGTCWAASCECGYVFDNVADATGRWFTGRLRCHECAAPGPG